MAEIIFVNIMMFIRLDDVTDKESFVATNDHKDGIELSR